MRRILLVLMASVAALQAGDLWSTDYTATLQQAAAEKRNVLLEFTGSDWCPPCMQQAKQVFDQPEFADFAKDNLLLVKLDFPRRAAQDEATKKRNQDLAAQYSVEGFPTVILLDPAGKQLARQVGYPGGGVEAFLKWVKSNTP